VPACFTTAWIQNGVGINCSLSHFFVPNDMNNAFMNNAFLKYGKYVTKHPVKYSCLILQGLITD
jgi:hypothetical protein